MTTGPGDRDSGRVTVTVTQTLTVTVTRDRRYSKSQCPGLTESSSHKLGMILSPWRAARRRAGPGPGRTEAADRRLFDSVTGRPGKPGPVCRGLRRLRSESESGY